MKWNQYETCCTLFAKRMVVDRNMCRKFVQALLFGWTLFFWEEWTSNQWKTDLQLIPRTEQKNQEQMVYIKTPTVHIECTYTYSFSVKIYLENYESWQKIF